MAVGKCVAALLLVSICTVCGYGQNTPSLVLRQTASSSTPGGTCTFDDHPYGTLVTCTDRPQTMTVLFNATLKGSALMVSTLIPVTACIDSRGQQWTGYNIWIPPAAARTDGLTSLTCNVSSSFFNLSTATWALPGSAGYEGEEILQFWEVASATAGMSVQADPPSLNYGGAQPYICTAVPPLNGLAIAAVLSNQDVSDASGAIGSGLSATNTVVNEKWNSNVYDSNDQFQYSFSFTYFYSEKSDYATYNPSGAQASIGCSNHNCGCLMAAFRPGAQLPQGGTVVEAQLITPASGTATADSSQSDIQAHIPLGSKFQFTIEQKNMDGTTQPAPGSFGLDGTNVTGPLDKGALFPNNVLLTYAPPDANSGLFEAVHIGTVRVTASPSDPSLPPMTITINVENPAAVGSSHPEVDAVVLSIADRKGILPQYMKGQMWHESNKTFDPMSYRYEPLSKWVGDYAVISRGLDYRANQTPYKDYRYATATDCKDPALGAGALLLPADITVAYGKYQVCVFPLVNACHPLGSSDQMVTAVDIVRSNPAANYASNNPGNYNAVMGAFQKGDVCGSVWTAQTSLAASYGMMQVMYVTAIDAKWAGTTAGAKNPTYLFDTTANQSTHGGSVELGGERVRNAARLLHSQDVNNPQFSSEVDLQQVFLDAWGRYNTKPAYPGLILDASGRFPPAPTAQQLAIFGGAQ